MGFVKKLFAGNKYQADTGANGQDVQGQTQATQDAIAQQQAFVNAMGAQNGLQNQTDVYNQLSGIAAGTGPNPAQAMLDQATGANVANQASLMAGQRGTNANAGLIARQASQAGAGIQQQAAGQGAVMQANQSMNAINTMGNLANQQVGQQQQGLSALGNQQQALQSSLAGSAAKGSEINAGVAAANQAQKMGMIKGVTGALAKGGMMAATGGASAVGYNGGMVTMAQGGAVVPPTSPAVPNVAGGAKSKVSQLFTAEKGIEQESLDAGENIGDALSAGAQILARPGAQAGNAGMQASAPGAVDKLSAFAQGGQVGSRLKAGGKVPGKPAVGGAVNTLQNDTVDAKLSPGEVVIPRSVMMSSDPVNNAAKFVAAIMARNGGMKGKR